MELGKKVLNIDIDGVLTVDTCTKVLEWVNQKYDVGFDISDVYQFDQTLKIPNGDNIKLGPLFREFTKDKDFVMSLTPDGDAVDLIRFLSDCYYINIASSRPEESLEYTLEWLNKNNVYYDSVELPSPKLLGDVLIDDYDENILKFLNNNNANKLGVLFVQPWSINIPEAHKIHCNDKRFKMCYNWNEVYDELNNFWNLIC